MRGKTRPADHSPDRTLEAQWMMRIAAGDMSVYRAVIDAYMADVQRFCASLLGDSGRAEDATQETFIRLWTQAEKWKPTGRLKSWLFKIAHNLCIDEMRTRKNHIDLEKVKATLRDPSQGAREAIMDAQNARIIRTALAQLPARQRMAVTLVHYLEHDTNDAARTMGMTQDAFESLLRRGRARLKTLLAHAKNALL